MSRGSSYPTPPQHSFGIPCEIRPIVELANAKEIFLLEDCAISLGSSIDGICLGNFGDAALFSTDHSKPINSFTGGLIYTQNEDLFQVLYKQREDAQDLHLDKQQVMWQRLIQERKYCNPQKYSLIVVTDLILSFKRKFSKKTLPFLDKDFQASASADYPYPAQLPAFLAMVGIHEVARWSVISNERKEIFAGLIKIAQNSKVKQHLPKAYFNQRYDIVPLRFVWSQPDGPAMRKRLSGFVQVTWTWFLKPIIATNEPLEKFGYIYGSCPIAERTCGGMVNIPCNLSLSDSRDLLKLFSKAIEK